MLRSFRFRLAILSTLISGLVVVLFGSIAWWSLSRTRIEALDDDLKHFGFRVALRSGPNVDSKRLETSLVDVFGSKRAENRFLALLNSRSRVLFSSSGWPAEINASDFAPGTTVLDPQPVDTFRQTTGNKPEPRVVFEPRFYTTSADDTNYRIGIFANPDVTVVLGADLKQHSQDMHQLRKAFLVALPVALLLVGFGAAYISWRALRPVATLSLAMENVSAQDLSSRLALDEADREFEQIIASYNAMLERLDRSFHQATRFSADVSHELKTPLTIMQGALEKGLTKCKDGSEAQAALTEVLEQTGKQRSILESLLLLSRADAGKLELSREKVNLSKRLDSWLEDAEFLAEQKQITISSEVTPELSILADPIALQQVAHNLFSNAVRYNREGGEIECHLTGRAENYIEWTISNTGPSIPIEENEQIFERFYRSKNNGTAGGIGLGLSLVKEIIHAHEGTIMLDDSADGINCFRIRLPR